MNTQTFLNTETSRKSPGSEINKERIEKSFEAIFEAIHSQKYQKKHRKILSYKRKLNKPEKQKETRRSPEIIDLPFVF
ncbi:MAG: hypothetical protein K8R21_01535 [Leptospira sp.]|nr:hypothetical protein [Leptospira sp.]